MAAKGSKTKHTESIFWTSRGLSEKEQSVVPGVSDLGNLRPRVKGGRTKEVRASIPVVQPVVENLDPQNSKSTTGVISEVSQSVLDTDVSTTVSSILPGKKVALRDLCAEDKKRVANLIKELAKVGEEKENAQKNLEHERKHYEGQILKLVEQQEQILKEREDVQSKLLEYQTYILKLQQQQQLQHLHQQQKTLQHKRKHQHEQSPADNWSKSDNKNKINNNNNNNVKDHIDGHGKENTNWQISADIYPGMSQPVLGSPDLPDRAEDAGPEDTGQWVEEDSRNLYINQMEETKVENFSTQAQPALSPPPVLETFKLRPQRPFTALIDKELANQRQILAAAAGQSEEIPVMHKTGRQDPGNLVGQADLPEREGYPDTGGKREHSQQKKLVADGREVLAVADTNQQSVNRRQTDRRVAPSPFVSPEKNELITRYIQSQREAVANGYKIEPQDVNVGSGGMTKETEGVKPERGNKQKAKRRKEKKPPPPSYGPLHPPIMSSTQKSSEFIDVISVDSTVVSNPVLGDHRAHHNRNSNNNYHDDDNGEKASDDNDTEEDEAGSDCETDSYINNYNNNNNEDTNINKGKKSAGKKEKSGNGKEKTARVEFSDQPGERRAGIGAAKLAEVDRQFVNRYKQMSASERRMELLKQRTMLMEEQNRLKKILADQEFQLKVKQEEALSKMKQMDNLDETEKDEMKKMQDSLRHMEEDLARKEQELIQGRQQLAKKREAHARLWAEDASPVDKMEDKQVFRRDNLADGRWDGLTVPDKLSTPQKEKQIDGKDGDSYVLYRDSKAKDAVKKQLDYSFNSDAEFDAIPKSKSNELGTTHKTGSASEELAQGPSASQRPSSNEPTLSSGRTLGQSVASTSNEGSVIGKKDVGTSISYGHLPRSEMFKPRVPRLGRRPPQKPSTLQNTKKGRKNSNKDSRETGKFLLSPGEKTPSVLELINYLDTSKPVTTVGVEMDKKSSLSKLARVKKQLPGPSSDFLATLYSLGGRTEEPFKRLSRSPSQCSDDLNTGRYYSPSPTRRADGGTDQDNDVILDLFKMQRKDREGRGGESSAGSRRYGDLDICEAAADEEEEEVEDLDIDEIVRSLVPGRHCRRRRQHSGDDDEDIDVSDADVEDEDNEFEERSDDGLVDFVLKNIEHMKYGKCDDDSDIVLDEDEVASGCDSQSELHESQILEDVFFVN